jgi:hypothetical protein
MTVALASLSFIGGAPARGVLRLDRPLARQLLGELGAHLWGKRRYATGTTPEQLALA